MKTDLYDVYGKIMTFEEVKQMYGEYIKAELPISDDEMLLLIEKNLGKKEKKIHLVKDNVLNWCNRFAEYKQAGRFLSECERDVSIRDLYISIMENDSYAEKILYELRQEADAENLCNELENIKGGKNNAKRIK